MVRRRIHVHQPAQLLEAWAAQYSLATHTSLAYYSFEPHPPRLMKRIAAVAKAKRLRYAVTSFAAASLVAPFVHGVGTVQCYVEGALAAEAWVNALDLRPVQAGPNVILLVPHDAGVLDRTRAIQGIEVACPVQLYLDLVHDPARGREQAEFLRSKVLKF